MSDASGKDRQIHSRASDTGLAMENQVRMRALEAIRLGDLDGAQRVVDADHGRTLTLEQVFRLYQTELENQALQLRDSQLQSTQAMEWFANLFRSLPVSALLVDAAGMIVDANAHAIDELEIKPPGHPLPQPIRRLMASMDGELRLAAIMAGAQTGVTEALDDLALRSFGGTSRWADLRLTRLADTESGPALRGQPARFVCVFNDRTARVAAERASEKALAAEHQRDVAQSANDAKTRLLGRVSHELRTPLNAVLGFSQLLLLNQASLAPQSLERVKQIQRAGTHLLSLVDEVLEINQAEFGQLRVAHEAVSLRASAREAMALQQPAAERQAVSLHLAETDDSAPWPDAWADTRRVREVLANLISNAIKYNVAGGRIDIRLGQGTGTVWLEVTDTGIGMSAEQLQHLYEPFNRLGAERLSIEGHGLGLSIARALVQAMDGHLTIQAQPGLGTTCRLELPQAPLAA